MKFCIKLLLVLLCWPALASGELAEALQDDFAVREGAVVMPLNGEYLVDLDARDNLQIGDILTLVKPGAKILHPLTNEVLGSIDEPLGFLQVTRVHSGYSYVKPLSAGLTAANGAPVKRFEQVPAVLIAEDRADRELARQIKVGLPQLRWLENAEAEQALLTFTLQGAALQVKNAQGDALHKYNVSADRQLVSAARPAPRPYVTPQTGPQPGPLQQLATTLLGNVAPSNEKRFAEMDAAILRQKQADRQGIWMGPNLGGHPVALAVADFDGDGRQETAIALDNTIQIARVSAGQFDQLAEVSVPKNLQMLSVDALDLDGDGRAELYVSAFGAMQPSSFVVQFDGNGYAITVDNVRWFLRGMTLPGEEARGLFAQRLGNSLEVFAGEIFRVRREGDNLVAGEAVTLPAQLDLFNFIAFQDNRKEFFYVYLTNGDYLRVISAEGAELWASEDYFGGSEDCFSVGAKLRDEMQVPTCMRPRMVMTPGNEILVVQNDGQRLVQRYRAFKRSRLVALEWNGFALTESWQTASQAGYLGDFALADGDNDGKDELVKVVKFKHKGLSDEARSAVVIYELD